MKKKYVFVLALALLFIFTTGPTVPAQAQVFHEIRIEKLVGHDWEAYTFWLKILGIPLKDVSYVLVNLPNGKWHWLANNLGCMTMDLRAMNMSLTELQERFPVGNYTIFNYPPQYGQISIDVTHDFPAAPTITYPTEGQTDVPLTPVIQWEPYLGNIVGFFLTFLNAYGPPSTITLPAWPTSFAVDQGMLWGNVQYQVKLEAIAANAEFTLFPSTSHVVSFTTAAE